MTEQGNIFSEIHVGTVRHVKGLLDGEVDEAKKNFKASLADESVLDSVEELREISAKLLHASSSIDRKKQVIEQIQQEMARHNYQMGQFFKELGYPIPTKEDILPASESVESSSEATEDNSQKLVRTYEGEEYKVSIPPEGWRTPIEDLDLSTKPYNYLKRANVSLVRQVLAMSEEDLRYVRYFGKKDLTEVVDKLRSRGLIEKVQN